MKNIILIGMPGAGKSTAGVLLAKSLAFDFTDTDLIIQKQQGKPLQQIIDKIGIEGFLKDEELALLSVDCNDTVIATGGSAVFSERGMEHLKQSGICVYIRVPEAELTRRLTNIKTRGIACKKGETVAEIMAQREPYYEKYADITVDCDSITAEELTERIINSAQNLL